MKKILLILLAALTAFQMTVAVSAEEQQPAVPSVDVQFARALGIINSETDPAEPLTRIELAEIYYNIISNGVMPDNVTESRFSDVTADEAGYADFMAQCGIMNGVSQTEFDTQGSVTYIQLLKTLVTFLGYEKRAEANGGYPYGYLITAKEMGIVDEMTPSLDSVITVSKAATAFKLATNVSVMKRISFGSTEEYDVIKGTTYLSMYLDTKRVRGVVTANYLVDFDGDSLRYDQIKIDGVKYYVESSCADIKNLLGYKLDVYATGLKDDEQSITYYETVGNNKAVVVDGEDIEELSGSNVLYKEDGKTKKFAVNAGTKVVYNASLCGNYDSSTINPFKNTYKDGSVTLIDNNGDDICDLISVDAYDTYVVSDVVDNVIFNEYRPAEVVDLGDDYKEGDIEIVNILNEPLPFSDIEAGDIISVSRNQNGEVRRITVTIDSYTGTVDSISEEDNLISINETPFKMSRSVRLNPQYADLKPGNKITVYFNKEGKVSDIEAKAYEKYKIGYVVDASSGSLDTAVEMKIFTSGEAFEILPLAEKVTIRSMDKRVTAKEAVELAGTAEGSDKIQRRPMLYKLNDNGEINWIDYSTGTTPIDGLFMYEGFDGKTPRSSAPYRRSARSFGAKLLINEATVIFSVPDEEHRDKDDDYVIESPNIFPENDTSKLFEAYGNDKETPCAKILVVKGLSADESIDMYTDVFIVDKITDEIDEDGDAVKKVYGILYGTQVCYTADAETIKVKNGEIPEKGDIMRLGVSKKGKINYAEMVFDETGREITGGANPSNASYLSSVRYSYGEVIYSDGLYIKVKVGSPGEEVVESYPINGFRMAELDKTNGKKGTLKSATKQRLFGSNDYPGYSSKVFIHTRVGDVRTLVIYND